MQTQILEIDDAALKSAVEILNAGGLVVFPTETVYGLGADAENPDAVASVFRAKGRPSDNPLIVHVDTLEMALRYAASLSPVERFLIEEFSPGPFTLIAVRKPGVAEAAAAGHPGVGLRIPAQPEARKLITLLGRGIAAPSSNRSGRPSPTDFSMALAEMDGRVDAVIRGGACQAGLESTIVRIVDDSVVILRPGSVSASMMADRLHQAGYRIPVFHQGKEFTGEKIAAPGTRYRHYAPEARVVLFESLNELFSAVKAAGDGGAVRRRNRDTVVVRAILPDFAFTEPDVVADEVAGSVGRAAFDRLFARYVELDLRVPADLEAYGRELYRYFYEADLDGVEQIFAWLPPESPESMALRDRLARAAAG